MSLPICTMSGHHRGHGILVRLREEEGFDPFLDVYNAVKRGDKIEVLCSFGMVHRYTVARKRVDRQLKFKEVIVRNESNEEVVLDSSFSGHFHFGWRNAKPD